MTKQKQLYFFTAGRQEHCTSTLLFSPSFLIIVATDDSKRTGSSTTIARVDYKNNDCWRALTKKKELNFNCRWFHSRVRLRKGMWQDFKEYLCTSVLHGGLCRQLIGQMKNTVQVIFVPPPAQHKTIYIYNAWSLTIGWSVLFTMHCGILWVHYIGYNIPH